MARSRSSAARDDDEAGGATQPTAISVPPGKAEPVAPMNGLEGPTPYRGLSRFNDEYGRTIIWVAIAVLLAVFFLFGITLTI